MAHDELVLIGKLGRPRGVSGEIYVTPLTDFPERFKDQKQVYVGSKGRWERLDIVSVYYVAGRPVIRFANVSSPEEAARLVNCELAVTKDELVKLPEGTYYIFDIIGCAVIEHETERLIGEVTDVIQYPANDVYMIKTLEGQPLMVPVVREFVKSVDIEAKRIRVAAAGLIDVDEI